MKALLGGICGVLSLPHKTVSDWAREEFKLQPSITKKPTTKPTTNLGSKGGFFF